jgi:4-hydroxybenzoyl-CoA reductase subunit alpha
LDELKEYTHVGKRAPRIDALAKVTGEAQYWGDVKLPGTLIGKILTSPYAHARIVDIDTSKAERLPGVRAVVTGKDMPKTSVGHLALHALAIDKVRCVGEEVAAVAADNEGIAEEALKLIDVKYEALDAIYDPEEAMKHGAPKLYEDIENNILIRLSQEYGNVDNGFKEADYTFED